MPGLIVTGLFAVIVSFYLRWKLDELRSEVDIFRDQNRFYMDRYDNILKNWSRCTKLTEDVIDDNRKLLAMIQRQRKSDDICDGSSHEKHGFC